MATVSAVLPLVRQLTNGRLRPCHRSCVATMGQQSGVITPMTCYRPRPSDGPVAQDAGIGSRQKRRSPKRARSPDSCRYRSSRSPSTGTISIWPK
jgi:hypothetical protein